MWKGESKEEQPLVLAFVQNCRLQSLRKGIDKEVTDLKLW